MDKGIPLRDVMLKASLLMLFFMVSSKFLGYLFHVLFARSFPQTVYGDYIYLWSCAMFIAGLTPNIAAAVTRYVAFYRGSKDTKNVSSTKWTGLVLNILLSILVTLILLVCYNFGLLPRIQDPHSLSFVILVAVLVFNTNFFAGVITGYRRPDISSAANTIQNILRLVFIIIAVWWAASFFQLLTLISFSLFLYLLAILFYVNWRFSLGSVFNISRAKEIFRFGAYTLFFETANNILSWADIFLITLFLGSSVVAVYNVSWLASTASLLLFMSALQIFKPVVTELFGAGKKKQATYLTSYMFESFFLLFLPIFFSVVFFSREILVLFVNESYASGAAPLQILALGSFFYGMALLFMEVITADGKPQINAKNIGVCAIVNFTLNLLLIPQIGMLGAALATLVSSALLFSLSYMRVKNIIKMIHSLKRIIKIVFSILCVWIIAHFMKSIFEISSLVILLVVLSILFTTYIFLVIVFRSLRVEDVDLASIFMGKIGLPPTIIKAVVAILDHGVYSKASP